jgi:hypothetical protein
MTHFRILAAGLVALLLAVPAHAGVNLKQLDDGTAAWEFTDGETQPVGVIYLNAHMTDISTSSSVSVVIPVTNAKVTLFQVATHGDITTADATISFWTTSDGDGTIQAEISNATAPLTITAVAGNENGDVDVFTPASLNDTLQRGQVIVIQTDGGSTNTVSASITITIEHQGD